MGFLADLSPFTPFIEKALSYIPDANQREKARSDLLDRLEKSDISQLEVNKVEAAHRSIFVSGWRPFMGWVCGIAFCFHFIILPILLLVASINGTVIETPKFDMQTLSTVLFGMLGLGGLRTIEKLKDKAR